MHLEIYKLAISFREELMPSKNFIGEKFMISCQNIHPWEFELQSIKFYLEGVAYTPIAIIGIIGRLKLVEEN